MLLKPRVPDLYGCQTDDGTILLDIGSGKYYAASPSAGSAWNSREFLCEHEIRLVGGLVDIPGLVALEITPVPRSLNAMRLVSLLSAVLRVVIGRALFGTGALIRSIRTLKAQPARAPAVRSERDLSAAIQAFRQMRPWVYTAQNRCLFDALILTHYLLHLGFDAVFVIGIHTRPFEAHAWTQIGTQLIDDLPERVKTFTAIVVA